MHRYDNSPGRPSQTALRRRQGLRQFLELTCLSFLLAVTLSTFICAIIASAVSQTASLVALRPIIFRSAQQRWLCGDCHSSLSNPDPVPAVSGWTFSGATNLAGNSEEGLLLMGELVNGTDAPQYEIDISGVFYDLQGEVVGIGGDRLFRSHHRWVSHLDDGFLSHRRKL